MIEAFLLIIALATAAPLAAPSSSPGAITATVQPPDADLCVSLPGAPPESRRCARCAGGSCRVSLPAEWTGRDLSFEATAPDHFPETRLARGGETVALRLTPHPRIDWKGWERGEPATRIEWLPADRSDEWRLLRERAGPGRILLPGEIRGIRLSPPPGKSPRTLFAAGPRAEIGTVGPLPFHPGAEVALCLEVQDRRRAPPAVRLQVRDGSGKERSVDTNPSGCAAVDGLEPGIVAVSSEPGSLYRLAAIRGRLKSGESLWLGTVPVLGPAILTVRVADSDNEHRYAVAVESANPLQPERLRESGRISAVQPGSWTLPAGDYRVSLRPEFLASSTVIETVVVKGSEERTLSFAPHFYPVSGLAFRGAAPLPGATLEFSRDDDAGREMTLRVQTGEDGSYAGTFGEPGVWTVVFGGPTEPRQKTRPLRFLVPESADANVDIHFPNGAVAGIVLDRKSGKSMGMVPLSAQIRETEGNRELSMDFTSDGDGRFRIDSLPASQVSIGVPDPIAATLRVRSGTRVVANLDGESEQAVELRLEPIGDGARLRVVDTHGTGILAAEALRADTGPIGALLGRSNDLGEISLPNDLPAGVPIYVIAAGHPWAKTWSPAESDEPRIVALTDPLPQPTLLEFHADGGNPPRELFWGLTDSAGHEVPVFFHLLRQGLLPMAQSGVATLPEPGEGAYSIWVRGAHTVHALGTVVLPSAAPLVLSLSPCGADCAGP